MRLANPPETPFHADSIELLFVSIVLKLTEISVDFEYAGRPIKFGLYRRERS
jgi:hypothetical protein